MAKTSDKTSELTDPIELLEQIDKEKLSAEIAETQNRLAALRVLQKAVAARDGELPEKPPRKKSARRGSARDPSEPLAAMLFKRIVQYLEHSGPARMELIAAGQGIDSESVERILTANPQTFEKTGIDRWRLKQKVE